MVITLSAITACLSALAKYGPEAVDMICPGIDTQIDQLEKRIRDVVGSPDDCQCGGNPDWYVRSHSAE